MGFALESLDRQFEFQVVFVTTDCLFIKSKIQNLSQIPIYTKAFKVVVISKESKSSFDNMF